MYLREEGIQMKSYYKKKKIIIQATWGVLQRLFVWASRYSLGSYFSWAFFISEHNSRKRSALEELSSENDE